MDSSFFDKLEQINQDLVINIENHIEKEISVEFDESKRSSQCEIESYKPKITLKILDTNFNATMWHELTHIHRFCVQEIPRLIDCLNGPVNPEIIMALRPLDNDLEHLSMIPEEINIFTSSKRDQYWESRTKIALENINYKKPDDLLLRHWFFLQHVLPGSDLIELIRVQVTTEREESANQFIEKLTPLIDSKEKLVQEYFSYFNISTQSVCFEYLDVRNETSKIIPIYHEITE